MGPIGYAVAYRTLRRDRPGPVDQAIPPQAPGRARVLASLVLLVLLVVLAAVTCLDGDWVPWVAVAAIAAALGFVTVRTGSGRRPARVR